MNRRKRAWYSFVGVLLGACVATLFTVWAIADPGGWEVWRVALATYPTTTFCGFCLGVTYPG